MHSFLEEKKTPIMIFLTGMVIRLLLVAIANYQMKLLGWQGLFLGKGYNLENNLGEVSVPASFFSWNWEGFLDYIFWYTSGGSQPQDDHGFTVRFLNGELPYRDWGAAYNMTPLFIFMLEPFWALPLGWWGPALPIIACDALIGVVIYGIAKRLFHDERKATLAGFLAVLSPVMLFYVGYLWLNPGIFTLFALASLYYLLYEKYDASAVMLGLAVMSKQVAGIFFPFILIYVYRNRGKSWLLCYFLIFTAICLAISAPFLIVYPNEYISMLRSRATGPVRGVFTFPKFNETVSLTAVLQYYAMPEKFIWYVGVVVNTYAVFIFALVVGMLSLEQELRVKESDVAEKERFFFMIAFAAMTIMIALFPLGVYKYYMASLAPFWALYAVEAGHQLVSRRSVGNLVAVILWALFNLLVLSALRIWNPYLATLPFIVFFLPRVIRKPSVLWRPLDSLNYFIDRVLNALRALIRRGSKN